MFLPINLIISVIFSINSINSAWGDRTKDKMYETIEASKACFRRLNATHQVGCTSNRGGSTGVIHYCTVQKDLDYILRNGTAPPYVPIIPTTLFTASNINALKSHKSKVSGLIIYLDEEKRPEHFSHDHTCPNPTSSLPNTCSEEKKWNEYGTGLLYADIPFPMFYVENADNLSGVRECFVKHNNFSFDTQRDRVLCSLELNTFMYATTSTPTCIRRSNAITNLNPVKFCDPLGDQNVWASLQPLANSSFKHILVTARLDTTSLFEKTAGAVSPTTGIVTLIATAKLLKEMLVGESAPPVGKNVIFVLFNGESYDYIGSQRFVYEMLKGNFPVKKEDGSVLPTITIDDIEFVVELSQLSYNKSVVAHFMNKPASFVEKLSKNAGGGEVRFEQAAGSLPPASLHTFTKNRTDFVGLVLADHKEAYTNVYYNSIYDNGTSLKYKYGDESGGEENIQKHTVRVSEMLAKSLFEEITGREYTGSGGRGDFEFVDELYHCYIEDANCRVHQAVQKVKLPLTGPVSLYVGVEIMANFLTRLAGLTLAWVTGDVVGEGDASCMNEKGVYATRVYNMSKSLDELNVTKCVRVTMNLTEAVSPAFVIKDYDWGSGEYSTWAESTWGEIGLRMFLKPSAAHENMTIAIGSIVLVFSSLLVYFVKSKAEVLFDGGRRTAQGDAQPASC